jgi:hypothetical protein
MIPLRSSLKFLRNSDFFYYALFKRGIVLLITALMIYVSFFKLRAGKDNHG